MAENLLSADEFPRWWKETGERELREILFWRWDPIGVFDAFPNTADEYDWYAPQIVQALRKGASADEIATQLAKIEREEMGLGSVRPEQLEEVAEFITTWFENSQDYWQASGPMRR